MKILAIVEKKFFSLLDVLAGVDSYPVIAVDQKYFHSTVGLRGMVGEPYLPSHPEIGKHRNRFYFPTHFLYLAASTQNSSFRLNM